MKKASGGVAIFIKDDITYKEIPINTSQEAIAVSIKLLDQQLSICNVYIPSSIPLSATILNDLINQIPKPVVMVGDFNAHNSIWGAVSTDHRGQETEEFIETSNLHLLNSGAPTRFNAFNGNFSAIDLTLCSTTLAANLSWNVEPYLYGSDHFPITLHHDKLTTNIYTIHPKWKIDTARWQEFSSDITESLHDINELAEPYDIDTMIKNFNNIILNAANRHIGKTPLRTTQKIVPWWNPKCAEVVRECKKAFNKMKRNPIMENILKYKELRAKKRFILKKSKKESWQNYVSKVTPNTPLKEVWEKIRRIKGAPHRPLTSLINEQGQVISSAAKIGEMLAEKFQAASSTSNYNTEFSNYRTKTEREELFVNNAENELNMVISYEELEEAMQSFRNTSPGPDDIPIVFLKNLPTKAKKHLLKLFNIIWSTHSFPKLWTKATIVPILKPGKEASEPSSYRPIALTCTTCKLLEKIINHRIMWYLENNNLICREQSGFRRHRNTQDNIIQLESQVRLAFNNNQKQLCIFFDIEKAYDMVWKRGILQTLCEWKIGGNMYYFIENFLSSRSFRVRVNNELSKERELENGCPQGSVLSVTLFLIAINSVTKSISFPVSISLFADDIFISARGQDVNILVQHLQNALNKLEIWSNKTGFRFSPTKTKYMLFSKRNQKTNINLQLYGQSLEQVKTIRFLGMQLDCQLTWKSHVDYLKTTCTRLIGLLKVLANQSWGADSRTLLMLYRSLVRSRLEYGIVAYGTCHKTTLKKIEVIENTALRVIFGAYRTTPVESLHVIANEIPLYLKIQLLTLNYSSNVSASPAHPNTSITFSQIHSDIYKEKPQVIPPIYERVRRAEKNLDLTLPKPLSFQEGKNAPWTTPIPTILLDLATYNKENTPHQEIRSHFTECISNFPDSIVIYTDGSRSSNGTGAAIFSTAYKQQYRLPLQCCIYNAELYAILEVLRYATQKKHTSFVICSDSLSALQSLKQIYSRHPLVQLIADQYNHLQKESKQVTFIYTPSHIGIPGNEEADLLAKTAHESPDAKDAQLFVYEDLKHLIKTHIIENWQSTWNESNSHLRKIQKTVGKQLPLPEDRKSQVILSRLRLGHTKLTHSWILQRTPQPSCDFCNEIMTVEHLTTCHVLTPLRIQLGLNAKWEIQLTQNWETLKEFLLKSKYLYKL